MNQTAFPFLLALAIVAGGGYAAWKVWAVSSDPSVRSDGGVRVQRVQGPPIDNFEMTRSDGTPFRSDQMKGKVWVASFFFTTCPGSCKKLNTNIRALQLNDELKDVHWVSMTVDPANDTLAALEQYAQDFDADPERWWFLRSDLPYVRRVARDIFKLHVSFQTHTDYGVLVDKQGIFRGAFNLNSRNGRQNAVALLKELLAEESPQISAAPQSQASELETGLLETGMPPEPAMPVE